MACSDRGDRCICVCLRSQGRWWCRRWPGHLCRGMRSLSRQRRRAAARSGGPARGPRPVGCGVSDWAQRRRVAQPYPQRLARQGHAGVSGRADRRADRGCRPVHPNPGQIARTRAGHKRGVRSGEILPTVTDSRSIARHLFCAGTKCCSRAARFSRQWQIGRSFRDFFLAGGRFAAFGAIFFSPAADLRRSARFFSRRRQICGVRRDFFLVGGKSMALSAARAPLPGIKKHRVAAGPAATSLDASSLPCRCAAAVPNAAASPPSRPVHRPSRARRYRDRCRPPGGGGCGRCG